MKKVLVGFFMDGKSGGIDNYLKRFIEKSQNSDVQIDFLTNEIDLDLQKELMVYQSKLYAIPTLKHPIQQYRSVCSLIKKERYDTVYLNISTAIDCVAAFAAKRCKVKRVMIHSHSSGNDCENGLKRLIFNTIHQICKKFLYRTGTNFYGCSNKAGLWMFPKKIVNSEKFEVVFNAIHKEKFEFQENMRNAVRKELGIENNYVIGHVGNFCYQKNHVFLIKVFQEILRLKPNANLLLLGKGVRFDAIQKQVQTLGIEHAVKFLGWRKDVNCLLQAMDLFLLPSNFEGLPTVAVEAQCAGLTCVMSDKITTETKITEHCYFIPLHAGEKAWAKFVVEHGNNIRTSAKYIGEEQYDASNCNYPSI